MSLPGRRLVGATARRPLSRMLQMHVSSLLVAACAACLVSGGAHAQPGCDIDEAQRFFGQQPGPVETVERLLADCQKAGSTDYRVYMFLGVMARDAGERERAIEFLKKAHDMAPEAQNPALELAFTLEAKHAREAGRLYDEILKRDPSSRPAMLGLARVARSQNRLDEAHALYQRLLEVNPKYPAAPNRSACLAPANRYPAHL